MQFFQSILHELPMDLKLLFLHYVFWLGQHVYTRTCLHANVTQTAGSLTAASTIFNFHFRFWSTLCNHVLPLVKD